MIKLSKFGPGGTKNILLVNWDNVNYVDADPNGKSVIHFSSTQQLIVNESREEIEQIIKIADRKCFNDLLATDGD